MLMCLQFSVWIFEISLYARSLKSYWHIRSKAFPYFYLNSSMPKSCLIFKASLYARSLESYLHIHYTIVGFSVYLFKNFHANLLTIFRLICKASMYARSLQCMLGTDWQNQLVFLIGRTYKPYHLKSTSACGDDIKSTSVGGEELRST